MCRFCQEAIIARLDHSPYPDLVDAISHSDLALQRTILKERPQLFPLVTRRRYRRSLPLKVFDLVRRERAPRKQKTAGSGYEPALRVRGDYCGDVAVATGCSTIVPIVVPITSPETISSTRRFCWRPSEVSFDAMGLVFPKPFEVVEDSGMP